MGNFLPTPAVPATPTKDAGATEIISGSFTAAGQISAPWCIYGAFNVVIYPQVTATLTTKAGSAEANISALTTLQITGGANVTSPLGIVPPGTDILSVLSTIGGGGPSTVQLGGLTSAQITGLTATSDPGALFTGIGLGATATIILERSFDGGKTWINCGVGGTGTAASYQFGTGNITGAVSIVVVEPEKGVAYRLHCTSYTSGTLPYRISASGLAAAAWGIPVG